MYQDNATVGRGSSRIGRATLCALLMLVVSMVVSPIAHADFGIVPGSFTATTTDPNGNDYTQAGGHPFAATTSFALKTKDDGNGTTVTDGNVKNVSVDLPAGFVGNPQVAPTCSDAALETQNTFVQPCPVASQVGVAGIHLRNVDGSTPDLVVPVYNVKPNRTEVAAFTFSLAGQPVHVAARVRPDDYGLRVTISGISEIFPVEATSFTLWGVPADPAHDAQRGQFCAAGGTFCFGGNNPAGVDEKPFLTIPTDCARGPLTTSLSVSSYQDPSTRHTATALSPAVTGCDKLRFAPSVRVQPASTSRGAPAGLSVDIDVPQTDNPAGVGTPELKDAVVTLPDGMTVSPSGADGLAGCSDAEIGLGTSTEPSCPLASKIGDVTITTPLLPDPLVGSVYLGTQTPSQLLRLFLVARGAGGLLVKIPGKVDPDLATGQLTATFANNPQLPFSNLHLELKGGARAPLVNPSTCGTKTSTAALTPWSSADAAPVVSTSTFDVSQDGHGAACPPIGFAPSFTAGSSNPAGGRFSPFVVSFARSDADKELSGLSVKLPRGLLAKVAGVPLCPDAQAVAGTCDAASRVGSATVGAGPGSSPFFLTDQPVYLTGPYNGGPYGLAVVIRAIAGPFDLGTVVVRQSVRVDRNDASLTVVSDSFPTILQGIPLKIRRVDVNVDRPGFTTTPTSCAPQAVTGTLTAVDGTPAAVSSRYQAADCASLPFTPKMSMRLTNRSQTTDGKHPGLDVLVTQPTGQANLRKVVVSLPLSLALDPKNSQSDALCSFADGLKDECPVSSEIGTAAAVSPLLNRPLNGKVYFVKGLRLNKQGQLIRTLPTLLVQLRGEIDLDLRATSQVDSRGRLVTTFANIPDAALSGFRMQLRGGKKGILVVTGHKNLCRGRQLTDAQTDGQNAKTSDFAVTMKTPCANAGTRATHQSNSR